MQTREDFALTVSHVVLQQAYHADQSMTIGNVEVVPLYLHCLRQAAPELQLRGLQVWKKLLQGNMANLSAADRSALPCLLYSTTC